MIPPLARSTWPLIQPPSGPARKADRVGDVLGLAEPLQRRELGEVIDHLLRLAVEEQLGCRRPRCDGVDRDVAAAQLFGEDVGHRLDAGLGRGVDAVGRLEQADDAGRHVDDAAAFAQPLRRFTQGVEGALQVDRDWRSNSASSLSAIVASRMMPALFTSTSTPPNAASAPSNMRAPRPGR